MTRATLGGPWQRNRPRSAGGSESGCGPFFFVLRSPESELPVASCPIPAFVDHGTRSAQEPGSMFASASGARPFVADGAEEICAAAARSLLVPIRLLEQRRREVESTVSIGVGQRWRHRHDPALPNAPAAETRSSENGFLRPGDGRVGPAEISVWGILKPDDGRTTRRSRVPSSRVFPFGLRRRVDRSGSAAASARRPGPKRRMPNAPSEADRSRSRPLAPDRGHSQGRARGGAARVRGRCGRRE